MKKIISIIVFFLLASSVLIAQQVPQGMKYQAVARNLQGEIMANEKISLRISLNSMNKGKTKAHYSERHDLVTNELGLFTLVIGEGKSENIKFSEIPWSTEDIWMQVSIAEKGKGGFTDISYSKLMTVPYAFHAGTASRLSGNQNIPKTEGAPNSANTWSLPGNLKSNPDNDYVGTADNVGLTFRTNAIERMGISNNGDLNVLNNVNLNTASGHTYNKGNLTVDKLVLLNDQTQSSTKDIGALVVEGGVGIEKNLNVGGDLDVKGTSSFKDVAVDGLNGKSLNVADDNASYLATFENTNNGNGDGIKIILGRRHALHPSLGTSAFTLPSFSQNPFANTTSAFQNYFNNLINTKGSFSADDLLEDAGNGLLSDMENVAQLLASKLVDITNIVINKVNEGIGKVNTGLSLPYNLATPINNGLGLPYNISTPINNTLGLPYNFATPINTALGLPKNLSTPINTNLGLPITSGDAFGILDIFGGATIVPALPSLIIPGIGANSLTLPALPSLTIPALPNIILPAIPTIPILTPIDPGPLGNLSIDFTFPWDAVNDPLTNDNEFIGFYDKNGTKAGAIRGQSIGEWFTNYFDVPWFITTAESFLARVDEDAGSVGPFSFVKLAAKSLSTTIQFGYDFSNMGIEYSSGNGDYAEWLERADPKEKISYGDIVAVKGGKITKDLTGAEQIMAVSHKPIVLGNVPEKGKLPMGNNIAFMGQIPVKVMGPVKAGDYIVAKSEISGYGVAVNPENMNVEDYKLAVGRSWTTNENKGPKMVNTVVGVHNNGFLQIIKELQQKADSNDERLNAIEMKLNISNSTEKEKAKKPFK